MNKTELRAACKAAGISYAGLTVDGMRNALYLLTLAPETPEPDADDLRLLDLYRVTHCPTCHIHLSNGVLHDGDEKGDGTGHKMRLTHEFECMGCGTGFGKPIHRTPRKVVANPGSGTKREANRPKQNGVTRPSEGGKCRAVWDALDAMMATDGMPTSERVKQLAGAMGWNANNASIEFYQWRKFHGISGKVQPAA